MKYLFILGRNEELSIQEIREYLKKENNEIVSGKQTKNGFLVELDFPLKENTIKFLGGTISIGKVLTYGKKEELFKELEKTQIYSGKKNKLTYTLWDFSSLFEDIKEYLKNRFKEEKLKTSYKGLSGYIKNQEGKYESIPSAKKIEEEYFIFEDEKNQNFGKIIQKCDYEEIEKRDMEKPIRREELSISPRLSKILINLAGLKKGDTLYDPFCGIGVILSESLLQGINVIGSDINKEAIKNAKKNLEWFNFSKDKYELILGDSSKIKIPKISAIATEPDLGKILKKVPTKNKAKEILENFENLMIAVINNAKENVSGRIVFTSPYIKIGKKRIGCDINKIISNTNLKIVFNGLNEFREHKIVGRTIYVLEK